MSNLGEFYKALFAKHEINSGPYVYTYFPPLDPYDIGWPFDAEPRLNEAEWFYENDPDISTAILFGDRPFTVVQERA